MTRTLTTLAAALALPFVLSGAPAQAESPYPTDIPAAPVYAQQVLRDTGSEATPSFGRIIAQDSVGNLLPENGSDGPLQSANSVPGISVPATALSAHRAAPTHG